MAATSARTALTATSRPWTGTHNVTTESRQLTAPTAAKTARAPISATKTRSMYAWRRNRKIVRMTAKASEAQPSTASDIAVGQINPGCHCRHSTCGVSVDMSRTSPSKRPIPASYPTARSGGWNDGTNHTGFGLPRKLRPRSRLSDWLLPFGARPDLLGRHRQRHTEYLVDHLRELGGGFDHALGQRLAVPRLGHQSPVDQPITPENKEPHQHHQRGKKQAKKKRGKPATEHVIGLDLRLQVEHIHGPP